MLNVTDSFFEYCALHSRVLELHPRYECMYDTISCMYINRDYGSPICYYEHIYRLLRNLKEYFSNVHRVSNVHRKFSRFIFWKENRSFDNSTSFDREIGRLLICALGTIIVYVMCRA